MGGVAPERCLVRGVADAVVKCALDVPEDMLDGRPVSVRGSFCRPAKVVDGIGKI